MLLKLAAGTVSTREQGIKIQKELGLAEITFEQHLLLKRDKADPHLGRNNQRWHSRWGRELGMRGHYPGTANSIVAIKMWGMILLLGPVPPSPSWANATCFTHSVQVKFE